MRLNLLAAFALAACADRPRSTAIDAGADAAMDAETDARGSRDAEADAQAMSCAGAAPLCFDNCGSDFIRGAAVCRDGSWFCPIGVLASSCPPGTCWGVPTQGEVCGANGWECRPDPAAYLACPALMCPECNAWVGPTVVGGCACSCSTGSVACSRAADAGAP
jgi:hypothetical protein